ncbi:hypothetical protein A2634_04315 [Candidatus Amesbacteria bacterium RIFCSPHIGHO2_01_FULL_48_32]|uniref:RDD domain-containing protein n=1 Tax=Candidatus Amesbacteria bacterium RIFCSPLOWO2_01_FULL_48_25 TaxID=1797259 RepID=A0A1F4ZC54_9BACT|nr:MAG: hypothetical protein A2634_04315 [Candidatus Amesbacteria bacterium RIFCSPHIGHO2_01_FULL_48_32]OGD03873.1 MAG: hypothetical protein A2989_04190 [Candidatus Amesbacteria bacterium RIFCSPLOWO2_01_FULL_48_25]HJZ05464.1 RDD family protein [Patescibacteria group bacterium]
MPLESKPNNNFEIKPGGAWARFWASIIDGMIFGIPAVVIVSIWYLITGIRISKGSIETNPVYTIIVLASYIIYYVYFTSKKGTTIGKDAYGLKVVKYHTDEKISYWRGIVRELTKVGILIIPIFGGLFYFVNSLVIIFSKQKRGLHDLAANSQVVRVKSTWPMKKQIAFFGGYILLFIAIYILWSSIGQTINQFLPTPVTKISTEQKSWKLFENKTDGWSIRYDDKLFKAPLLNRSDNDRKLTFNRAHGLDEFCLDSFNVEKRDNPSGLPLEQWLGVNDPTYNYQGKVQESVSINGIIGKRVTADNNAVYESSVPRKYRIVTIYLPFNNKVFILSYSDIYYWRFPKEECLNNEAAIKAFFETFSPVE